jgi:hypothetical protein
MMTKALAHLSGDTLVSIGEFLDGAELMRLKLTGCVALGEKLWRDVRRFETRRLIRFVKVYPILREFQRLTTLIISMKKSHAFLPINDAHLLLESLPATLVVLQLAFAQAPKLLYCSEKNGLVSSFQNRLPHLTDLSITGIFLNEGKLHLNQLPANLTRLQLINHEKSEYLLSYEAFKNIPTHLQHLELRYITIVFDKSSDSIDYSYYRQFPSTLTRLIFQAKYEGDANIFDTTSCLPHLEFLDLNLTSDIPSVNMNLPISKISPSLKYFSLYYDGHGEFHVWFDAPLFSNLQSFNLDSRYHKVLYHDFCFQEHIPNGSQLTYLDYEIIKYMHPNNADLILEKCAHLHSLCILFDTFKMNEVASLAAHLPPKLSSLKWGRSYLSDNETSDFSKFFLALKTLPLKSLALMLNHREELSYLNIPTLTSLNLNHYKVLNDRNYKVNLSATLLSVQLRQMPLLESLELPVGIVNSLEEFLVQLPQSLSALKKLTLRIDTSVIDKISHNCKSYNIPNIPNLKHLLIQWEASFGSCSAVSSFAGMMNVFCRMVPNLLTLIVLDNNSSWDFNNCSTKEPLFWLTSLPKTLKKLTIGSLDKRLFQRCEPNYFHYLPSKLEELAIDTIELDDSFANDSLLHLPPSLTSLYCSVIPPTVIPHLPRGMRIVRHFDKECSQYFTSDLYGSYGDIYAASSLTNDIYDVWEP